MKWAAKEPRGQFSENIFPRDPSFKIISASLGSFRAIYVGGIKDPPSNPLWRPHFGRPNFVILNSSSGGLHPCCGTAPPTCMATDISRYVIRVCSYFAPLCLSCRVHSRESISKEAAQATLKMEVRTFAIVLLQQVAPYLSDIEAQFKTMNGITEGKVLCCFLFRVSPSLGSIHCTARPPTPPSTALHVFPLPPPMHCTSCRSPSKMLRAPSRWLRPPAHVMHCSQFVDVMLATLEPIVEALYDDGPAAALHRTPTFHNAAERGSLVCFSLPPNHRTTACQVEQDLVRHQGHRS